MEYLGFSRGAQPVSLQCTVVKGHVIRASELQQQSLQDWEVENLVAVYSKKLEKPLDATDGAHLQC